MPTFAPSEMRALDADAVEDGYFEQRDYFPAFWDYWNEWGEAAAILADELAVILELDPSDLSPEAIEADLNDEWEADDTWQMLGLDLGIAGLTATLCAAGCQTVYSCRGHGTGGGGAEYPQVRFYCDSQRAVYLEEIGRVAGGCLEGPDDIGSAWLWSRELRPILAIASLLHERAEQFTALPAPQAAHQAPE